MNRKYRFVLYFLLCLSILTFPYIAEICIDVWVWLSKTIYTNCLIVSLCIAGIFLLMEFQIHTCKKEKKNNADRYKTTVSALYYDSPSTNDIFNRRSYAKLLLNKLYSSFYSNNSQETSLQQCWRVFILWGKILVFGQEILTLSLFKCKFGSMLMRINVWLNHWR